MSFLASPDEAGALVIDGPSVVAAPRSVADDVRQGGAFNRSQQCFNERQCVVLERALETDQGTIAAGTCVSSHMIFLNSHESQSGVIGDSDVEWTFDDRVLGVMSDYFGDLEARSTDVVGALDTTYPPPFRARGLEGSDTYSIDGNRVIVTMTVSEPGDWIRVITQCKRVAIHTTDESCTTRRREAVARVDKHASFERGPGPEASASNDGHGSR